MKKIKEAVNVLCAELVVDKDYRRSWESNIAMVFFDSYQSKYGCLQGEEIKEIMEVSNKAADNFLNMLCRNVEGEE